MAFIRLRRPASGRPQSYIEFRTHLGAIQTRTSTGDRPNDFAPYTASALQPASGEEEIALVDRVYGYCRRGWLVDDCRFTEHVGEGGYGAQRDHFELRCATRHNLGRLYAACQGLAILNPAFELIESSVNNRRFATIRRDGFPLLCIDLEEHDAYGTCELDSPLTKFLKGLAGLPGFSVAMWSDLDEDMHPITPASRYDDTDDGWAAWRDEANKIGFVVASRPNTPHPIPGYGSFRDRDGGTVTPVVL